MDAFSNPLANGYFNENMIRDSGVSLVKAYGSEEYRLIYCRSIKQKGFEEVERKARCSNTQKLENNLSRAKSRVYEIALCNDFEWFVTLTLSPEKYDRYNLDAYKKDLGKFINNYNQRKGKDYPVKYLLIPEMHKDGAWHMHGLLSGINPSDLEVNAHGYMDWKSYSKKFGFISMSKINDKIACAKYITKYVTKELGNVEMNKQCYMCSKGLNRSELLARSRFDLEGIDWDYEEVHGYTKIKIFHDDDFLSTLTLID